MQSTVANARLRVNTATDVSRPRAICHHHRLVDSHKIKYIVKRNNNFMCIKTEKLKFLDIANYLAPGFSYSQYLKAYKCTEQKGFFPYEWMTSQDKLNVSQLPAYEAFFSTLKCLD